MTVDTYIAQAQPRIQAEQEAVDAKLEAYETFIRRVRNLQTDQAQSSTGGITATGGTTYLSTDGSGTDRCRTVRTAFEETVRPHSVSDIDETESLLETIREEFTDGIAVALAPTTEASFTPEIKQMVLAGAQSRCSELTALQKALAREQTQLDDAAAAIDDIVAWIVEVNETPLTSLGFGALQQRHEKLASHRDRCEEVARDRQSFCRGTTQNGADAQFGHQSLMPYLYQGFPVDYPVLTTVAALNRTCQECQRAVRDHLVRRA